MEELEALAQMQGLDPKLLWINDSKPPSESEAPFVFIDLPSESYCASMISRSILIKGFVEVRGLDRIMPFSPSSRAIKCFFHSN